MCIQSEPFDTFKDPDTGEEIKVLRYILSNKNGVVVKVITYGASINSIEVPDKNGKLDHVINGFESLEGYTKFNFIGSTIGRHANRIKEGKFRLNGEEHQLAINSNNTNHLHGGKRGWDKYVWQSFVDGNKLTLTRRSPDGDQGYPGDVFAQTTYCLEDNGCLNIDYQAMASKATPINMTNHSFFNLAGHASGQKGLFEHYFQVLADSYLPVSSDLIPTGIVEPVAKTAFDFRQKKCVAVALSEGPEKGFDHCFCFSNKKRGTLELAAIIDHPPSGRQLHVFTTEPSVQVYTGNFMPKEAGVMVGRGGVSYTYQGAFCCEPQNYPDAVNNDNFPTGILVPGRVYKHRLIYKFSVSKENLTS